MCANNMGKLKINNVRRTAAGPPRITVHKNMRTVQHTTAGGDDCFELKQ